MAIRSRPLVEDLQRQIDEMLERKAPRVLAVTEENVRRVFGMSLWGLFRLLAGRFGHDVDEGPQDR